SNNDSRHKEQVGDPVWSVEKKEAKDAQEEEHAYEEHHFSYFVLESISCKSQRSLQPLRSQLVLEMLEGLLHLFHALRPLAGIWLYHLGDKALQFLWNGDTWRHALHLNIQGLFSCQQGLQSRAEPIDIRLH